MPFYRNNRYFGTMAAAVTRLGIILFHGFTLLDVSGPLQFFNQLSSLRPFELSLIAHSMAPVSTISTHEQANNTSFYRQIGPEWQPTHTFDNAPTLDILIVPGSARFRSTKMVNEIAGFIRDRYPQLKHLLSVCTGSVLVAAAGVLDGRNATTNKYSWSYGTRQKGVNWIPRARWVVDGNIWSSSGVAAGMDMTYAFIAAEYSAELAQHLANVMEYEPHKDHHYDPFADIWKVPS